MQAIAVAPSSRRNRRREDEALATADHLGYRAFEAELHRARGEVQLKRDPANPAPAEEAFLTAIAVAKQQGTRSFELRAALSLAKLYQSTNRPADAHAVLAPALEGFAPTLEMPEIAEAQALLGALTETGEVKKATASRQRRLQLQTGYSQALTLSRGLASEERKVRLRLHAQELATKVDNAAERFDAFSGLFIGNVLRGELRVGAGNRRNLSARGRERGTNDGSGVARRAALGLALPFRAISP